MRCEAELLGSASSSRATKKFAACSVLFPHAFVDCRTCAGRLTALLSCAPKSTASGIRNVLHGRAKFVRGGHKQVDEHNKGNQCHIRTAGQAVRNKLRKIGVHCQPKASADACITLRLQHKEPNSNHQQACNTPKCPEVARDAGGQQRCSGDGQGETELVGHGVLLEACAQPLACVAAAAAATL